MGVLPSYQGKIGYKPEARAKSPVLVRTRLRFGLVIENKMARVTQARCA